jgi:hypothetical protein
MITRQAVGWRVPAGQHGPRRVCAQLPRRQQQSDMSTSGSTASGSTASSSAASIPVTVAGFSGRGIDAVRRLLQNGGLEQNATTSVWCLDSDPNMLEASKGYAQTVHLEKNLTPADVRAIVGNTASDAGGKGNIGSGDGSLAFVLAPSSMAGGPESLLQLTHSFRAAGHFTVAAIVSPFAFEGEQKKMQSKQLVADLATLAHVVVVLDQDVLLQQSYGENAETLTVAESTEIANAALEHTVRCIVQAVNAPEMLKSTQGGLMWHGKELRHFKRLISPPLQQLLTQKGVAVLGRGLALLPASAAQSMDGGYAAAMMHLASEAVAGAAESPFVEGVLSKAGGVLCCLRVPAIGPNGDAEAEKAYRMAAQAAAGALRTITGRACDNFLVYVEKDQGGAGVGIGAGSADPEHFKMEATMLMLWSEENLLSGDVRASWKSSWNLEAVRGSGGNDGNDVNDGNDGSGSSVAEKLGETREESTLGKGKSASWGMMSAVASGRKPAPGTGGAEIKTATGFFSQKAAAGSGPNAKPSTSSDVKRPVVVKRSPDERPSAPGNQAREENISVGEVLAESLTAQSLDLPPAAARWRQEHRSGEIRQRRLVVWEVDENEPWEESDSKPANPFQAILGGRKGDEKKKVNVRDRMASVLANDRDEAWAADVLDQGYEGRTGDGADDD